MILPKSNRTAQLAWLWFLLFGFSGTGYGVVRWDVVTSPTEVINTGRSEVTGAVVLSVRGTGNVTGTSSGGPARIALIYSSPALQIDNTLPTIRLGRSAGFAAANPTIASVENRNINGRCVGFITINLLPGVKLAEKEFIRIHSMRARIDTSPAITPSTDLFVDLQSIDDPAAHSFSPERALVAKSFDAMNVNITSDAILLCYPTTGKAPAGTAIPSYNIRIAEGFARAFVDRDSNNDNNASNDRREEEGPALAAPTNSTQFLVWLEGIPTSVSGIIWPASSSRDRTNAQLILLDSGFSPSAGTAFGIYSFESLNQVGLSDLAVETFTLAPLIVLRSGVTTTGTILAAVALAPGDPDGSGCAAPSASTLGPRFQRMFESDEIATNNPKDDPPRPYAIINTCSSLMITTQSVPNGTVGVAYSTPPFEATGGKTPYSWSISAGALPAGLTQSSTTGAITGTPSAAGPFNFTVRVTDSTTPAPQTATRTFSGMIIPPPSQPPPTTITTPQSVPDGAVGVAYSAPFAATGGKTPYTWSISAGGLPAGLTQNSATGAITGVPTVAGPFNFTVKVTDSTTPAAQTATRSYSGMIISFPSQPPPPTITTESVPNGTVGVAYSTPPFGATGGKTPYSWSISAGALPAGLTQNVTTGAVTGTPSAAGPFNFTVRVTDSTTPSPQMATRSYSGMTNPSLTITTESVPNGTVGVAYSTPPFGATGGKTPYSWSISAGALPAGLTQNVTTGAVTGTPSAAGPFNFTVRVTDSTTPSPQMATRSYSGMTNPSLTITTESVPNGTVGVAYSTLPFEATGGKTPYIWSISAGALPAGLTQNPTTGAITGTPSAAGPFNFTVRVTDSTTPSPQMATRAYSGTISNELLPFPTITTESVPNGTVGVAYSTPPFGATGGKTPYSWSIIAGALPAGLTQNVTTGAITGTPSAAGPFNFTVRVTDSTTPSPQMATRSYSGTISDVLIPPTITTESVPNGTVGVVYSAAFAATDGTAPYAWAISAGSLPAGLIQNVTTGAITGTPSAAGPFNFTVRVTDSTTPSPQMATRSYSGTISDVIVPPTITTESVPNGTVGVVYSAAFAATGGTAPYTWAISAGSLPAGLTQNVATGAIAGTPSAAGPFNFTVGVTDSTTPSPQMASRSYSGMISPSALTITTESVPNGTVGVAYSAAFAATGGTAPYTWSISAGSLPAGLTQNSATGAITGTPTAAGSFNFTVRVTDSTTPSPQMASRSYSGMISPSALTITTESVPNGTVGVAYSAAFAATGGTAPYTWSISAGALLAGVTQNATTGAIAGTPTTAGAFSFTVKVTDNTTPTPRMASRAYSGIIGPARSPIERPSISGLSPSSIETGSSGFELTVNGSNFVKDSVAESRVRFNNQERPTTFLSSAQLRVSISERDVAGGGTVNITVVNTSGGAASNSQTFAITTPPPSICCLDPISAIAGSGPFTLIVYGSSFVPTSVVQWNGSNRNTTFIDHRTLTAAITAPDIASVGTASVRVFNPSPGGGPSDARTLEIRALVPGAPTITRINPTRVDAGGGDFTLTVNGTGFVPASMVQFNGQDKRTFFDNATQLRAIIPGSDIATGFTFAVTVTNPASFESFTNPEQTGTLISNPGVVTTLNPVPLLLGLNPTSAPARGTGFAATANGLNFVSPSPSGLPGSRIRWNGADRNTNYISNVQLTSSVSPADIPSQGTASVAVSNPGPGGGNSNSITFTVTNNRAALTTLFYPRLVSTAGNESSPDEVTGIAVANLSGAEATLTVTAFDKNGEEITGPGITNPASVSVASIEQIPLVDTDLLGSGVRSASAVGWIKVESTVQEVVGFFLNFNDRLSFLDGADVSSANLKSFILPEIEDQGFTQIHVANPDPAPATLTFELYKLDGTLRTPAVEREVKANGSMAEFFTNLFRGVTREGSDYIRATSNRGVVPFEYLGKTAQYVYGLNGQDATGGGRILYSPQYVVGGRDYRSTLSIVNLDSIAGQVMFEFIGGDGMPIGVTRVVPIAPRGKIYITDQNFFLDPTTHTEGYVKIASSGPKLAGSVVFGDPGRSQFSSALPLVSTPHSEVVFSQVASDDTYFTGVAILNPTNSVANTKIEVFDARGTLVATTDMSIPPAQRISKVLTEYFPNNLLIENQRSGYIKVKADTDVASFSLFGTHNQSVLSAVPPQVLPR